MNPERLTQTRHASPLRGLIAVNAALLLLLGVVTFNPTARAQGRPPGDCTMVSGTAPGAQADVVYIVDTFNQELIAVTLDGTTRLLDPVGYRNVARDAAAALQRRGS